MTPNGQRMFCALVWLGKESTIQEIAAQMGTAPHTLPRTELQQEGVAINRRTHTESFWRLAKPVKRGPLLDSEELCLEAIKRLGSTVTSDKIAEFTGIQNTFTVTKILDRLEDKHWITRKTLHSKRTIYVGGKEYGITVEKKKRKCLSCGKDFPSEGAGNRICYRCKQVSTWKQATTLNFTFWETGMKTTRGGHSPCVGPR